MTTTTTIRELTHEVRIPAGLDGRRAVWLLLVAQVAVGAPVPDSVTVDATGETTHLTVPDSVDVATWATRLGLSEPQTRYHPSQREPGLLLRYTDTCGQVASTWLTVAHLTTEPLPEATDAGADSAVTGTRS